MSVRKHTVLTKVLEDIQNSSGSIIATGVLMLLMGVFAMASPLAAGLSLALMVGVLLLVGGIGQLVFAFKSGKGLFAIVFAVLILTCLLVGSVAVAQDESGEALAATQVAEQSSGPEDKLQRGTPRGSIAGFLKASSNFDFELAAEFLDLRNLPRGARELGGPELARQLNHVLSRAIWFDDVTVSNNPGGAKGDSLPDYRDEFVVIKTQDGNVPLWMQHIPREDGTLIWKVSNRSVAQIPQLYFEYSYPPIIEQIRDWFPGDASLFGLEIFKWFILICSALLMWPLLHLLGVVLVRLFSSPESPTHSLWRKVLTGPVIAVSILLLLEQILLRLGAGALAQKILYTHTLDTLIFSWCLWNIANLVKSYKQEKLTAAGRVGAAKLIEPVTTFVKLLILLFGALFWMNNVGINITTVLAGLGFGGLAMALALQKPIEDVMGALTLFTQAPIKVGDLCRYDGYFGTVEDIGLRNTRIRTLTNTLVHIPNARIAHVEIENFSSRTKIRFWPTLRLRYDTTPEQLKTLIHNIREMLEQHERVYDEPLRVLLTELGEDAILIKLHAFLKTKDFPESLVISQELIFKIMVIVKAAGAHFALPGRSIYLEDASNFGSRSNTDLA